MQPLLDHHVHGVVLDTVEPDRFELLMNEGGSPAPPGTSHWEAPLGWAIRRWCAPVLDLDPLSGPDDYLSRRAELGLEASRRLLGGAGLSAAYLDTGHRSGEVCDPAQFGRLAGVRTREVVRVEAVFEAVAAQQPGDATGLGERFAAALHERAREAVGLKSIVAYRHGFDLDPAPPSARDVAAAAAAWLAPRGRATAPPSGLRLQDPVLLRHALWTAADLAREQGLPLQLHAGFGDADLDLHRADPVVFTPWVRAWSAWPVPLVFLHCYPYHRQAGYLASIWPQVYFDLGAALNHTGAQAGTVLAEALELTPFTKLLYSSDAFGLAELVYLGAVQHRRLLTRVLDGWVAAGEATAADTERIRALVAAGNAGRIYPTRTPGG